MLFWIAQKAVAYGDEGRGGGADEEVTPQPNRHQAGFADLSPDLFEASFAKHHN